MEKIFCSGDFNTSTSTLDHIIKEWNQWRERIAPKSVVLCQHCDAASKIPLPMWQDADGHMLSNCCFQKLCRVVRSTYQYQPTIINPCDCRSCQDPYPDVEEDVVVSYWEKRNKSQISKTVLDNQPVDEEERQHDDDKQSFSSIPKIIQEIKSESVASGSGQKKEEFKGNVEVEDKAGYKGDRSGSVDIDSNSKSGSKKEDKRAEHEKEKKENPVVKSEKSVDNDKKDIDVSPGSSAAILDNSKAYVVKIAPARIAASSVHVRTAEAEPQARALSPAEMLRSCLNLVPGHENEPPHKRTEQERKLLALLRIRSKIPQNQ